MKKLETIKKKVKKTISSPDFITTTACVATIVGCCIVYNRGYKFGYAMSTKGSESDYKWLKMTKKSDALSDNCIAYYNHTDACDFKFKDLDKAVEAVKQKVRDNCISMTIDDDSIITEILVMTKQA